MEMILETGMGTEKHFPAPSHLVAILGPTQNITNPMLSQPKLERWSYGSSMGFKPGWTKEEAKEGVTPFANPSIPVSVIWLS
ncbi:hypothetical protein TIFTF001_006442 [Ficus carica]|uniref:Uncharacterized protein n=1 Tax=Ficus carica TaxID=3494 RepID=A0AA88AB50_FICCA|nr:hypothetical protein TIFTF001_006442 [Ficus carica]